MRDWILCDFACTCTIRDWILTMRDWILCDCLHMYHERFNSLWLCLYMHRERLDSIWLYLCMYHERLNSLWLYLYMHHERLNSLWICLMPVSACVYVFDRRSGVTRSASRWFSRSSRLFRRGWWLPTSWDGFRMTFCLLLPGLCPRPWLVWAAVFSSASLFSTLLVCECVY